MSKYYIPGKYDKIQCPFDKTHLEDAHRFQRHLLKCRKNHPTVHIEYCPFNQTHVVLGKDLLHHTSICPDKARIDEYLIQDHTSDEGNHGMLSHPVSNWSPPEGESWDDDDDDYVFNPGHLYKQDGDKFNVFQQYKRHAQPMPKSEDLKIPQTMSRAMQHIESVEATRPQQNEVFNQALAMYSGRGRARTVPNVNNETLKQPGRGRGFRQINPAPLGSLNHSMTQSMIPGKSQTDSNATASPMNHKPSVPTNTPVLGRGRGILSAPPVVGYMTTPQKVVNTDSTSKPTPGGNMTKKPVFTMPGVQSEQAIAEPEFVVPNVNSKEDPDSSTIDHEAYIKRETRKLNKKLREIQIIEKKLDENISIDPAEKEKLEKKSVYESRLKDLQ